MSKRTETKQITMEAKVLRHLREQRGLSMRQAAKLGNLSMTIINHIENGRMDLKEHHLKLLLSLYGSTQEIYDLYRRGTAALPANPKKECMDLLASFNELQIRSVEPIIKSLATAAFTQKGVLS